MKKGKRRAGLRRYVGAAGVLSTTMFLGWGVGSAQGATLFSEDFEALPLGGSVEEGVAGPIGDSGGVPAASGVWTNVPPVGWVDDDSGVPGIAGPADNNGVFEWAGWNFTDRDWWVSTAGDQRRSEFTNASGTVMVADPDEWDDAPHPGGPPDGPRYDTFISTPSISLDSIVENSVIIGFDSSWRPEFDDDFHQTANITVSFDGGTPIEILRWESDSVSAFFHPDDTNEIVTLGVSNPVGASDMVLTFGLFDAGNDWWWAIDNIQVTGDDAEVSVPAPASAALLAVGLFGLRIAGRRRRRYA